MEIKDYSEENLIRQIKEKQTKIEKFFERTIFFALELFVGTSVWLMCSQDIASLVSFIIAVVVIFTFMSLDIFAEDIAKNKVHKEYAKKFIEELKERSVK